MQQDSFKASDLAIIDVFSDKYLFEMPPHQRPYAWETDQADQLLGDLDNAVFNGEDAYFLGSIVLIQGGGDDPSVHQVIDGQQRLATLTILLAVLRELSDEKTANEINVYIKQEGSSIAGTRDRYRLTLRERDRDFFQKNVQDAGKLEDFIYEGVEHDVPDSLKRIFENAKSLWETLERMSVERRNALATFIIQRCYLVVVTASDRISAHRIFSVLNARGLNLEPTDLLKADILDAIEPRDKELEYRDKWEDIEEELGREEFRTLFNHLYVIFEKDRHHRNLAEAFKEDVLDSEDYELDSVSFIDDVLGPFSDGYQIVANASYKSADHAADVNLYLQYLGWIDNRDWIPPVMAFHHSNKSDSAAFLRFLKDFDRLAYGLFILRVRRDPRINRYSNILKAIKAGNELSADAGGPLALTSIEKRDILRKLDESLYQSPPGRFTRPLLGRLSNALADVPRPIPEFNRVTVEHVLPQNPADESDWIKLFPSAEAREEWTHKLANLVLLSRRKNAQAQNYDFNRKKTEYFRRGGTLPEFALTTGVIEEPEWKPNVLKRRQRYLLDVLKREWRLG